MIRRLAQAGRFLATARHLRASQIGSLLRNRLSPYRRVHGVVPSGFPRSLPLISTFLCQQGPACGPDELSFLNVSRRIDGARMDWAAEGATRLWRYNLHYFDYLHWARLPVATRNALIESWIQLNPQGTVTAWEPYTLSLRTVNWVKYFVGQLDSRQLPSRWIESLALQLSWLSRNLEYHLLANHLLKNAKALFFGGAFFADEARDRLRDKGLAMLVSEAKEQMLQDGGHYERSLMYHVICLEDFLDVLVLIEADPSLAGSEERQVIRAAAERGMLFLEGMVSGDGDIPLFNDSAFGVAQPAQQVLEWGRSVLGSASEADHSAPLPAILGTESPPNPSRPEWGRRRRILFPDTGYFGYRWGKDSLIIDCGPVGPDYQPGHAHADALSFELCLDGRRVIVDSGTYDYEPGPLRQHLRGTRAHNTVMVDSQDQSEVWGVFRVARRARPLYAELGDWRDGELTFRGAHDGYCRLPGRVVHERQLTMSRDRWTIRDRVTGTGPHLVESFLHIHPDFMVSIVGGGQVEVSERGRVVLRISAAGGELQLEPSVYCPEFGIRLDNIRVVLRRQAELPLELGYQIERA